MCQIPKRLEGKTTPHRIINFNTLHPILVEDCVLIALLLNQVVGILSEVCGGNVVEGSTVQVYDVVHQGKFRNLLHKSKALVNSIDLFVLKDEPDNLSQVSSIGEDGQSSLDPYYVHVSCATGLLNTMVLKFSNKEIST